MTHVPVYERTEARRYLFQMPDDERELRMQIARDVWTQCIESGHAKRPREKHIPCSAVAPSERRPPGCLSRTGCSDDFIRRLRSSAHQL